MDAPGLVRLICAINAFGARGDTNTVPVTAGARVSATKASALLTRRLVFSHLRGDGIRLDLDGLCDLAVSLDDLVGQGDGLAAAPTAAETVAIWQLRLEIQQRLTLVEGGMELAEALDHTPLGNAAWKQAAAAAAHVPGAPRWTPMPEPEEDVVSFVLPPEEYAATEFAAEAEEAGTDEAAPGLVTEAEAAAEGAEQEQAEGSGAGTIEAGTVEAGTVEAEAIDAGTSDAGPEDDAAPAEEWAGEGGAAPAGPTLADGAAAQAASELDSYFDGEEGDDEDEYEDEDSAEPATADAAQPAAPSGGRERQSLGVFSRAILRLHQKVETLATQQRPVGARQ